MAPMKPNSLIPKVTVQLSRTFSSVSAVTHTHTYESLEEIAVQTCQNSFCSTCNCQKVSVNTNFNVKPNCCTIMDPSRVLGRSWNWPAEVVGLCCCSSDSCWLLGESVQNEVGSEGHGVSLGSNGLPVKLLFGR